MEIKTQIDGVDLNFSMSDNKKAILLTGTYAFDILHLFEHIYGMDIPDNFAEIDAGYGITYKPFTSASYIDWQGLKAYTDKDVVKHEKGVPKLHIIRWLYGNTIRSYCMSDTAHTLSLYANLSTSNVALPPKTYYRIVKVVNNLLGSEAVTYNSGELHFNWEANTDIAIEAQKLVYQLVSECFLTPAGYQRLILLPEVPIMEKTLMLKLITALTSISGHKLLLSTLKAGIMDLRGYNSIGLLAI